MLNAASFASLSGLIFAGDFACLYGSAQEEEVQDEGFSAQACGRTVHITLLHNSPVEVAEAKQKLEAADALHLDACRAGVSSPCQSISKSRQRQLQEKLSERKRLRQEAEAQQSVI